MTQRSSCPSKEQLAVFAAGQCADSEVQVIEQHIADCAHCGQWVVDEQHNSDFARDFWPLLESDETDGTKSLLPAGPLPPTVPEIEGYEFVRELGHGGQGVVWEAIQIGTGRRVAVKFLRSGSRDDIEREVKLAARLSHPNIITVFVSGVTTEGVPYYVMNYVDGVPLTRYVRYHALPLEATLRLSQTVFSAITHAHEHGVMHRDLKPSNILVDKEGNPRVLDFGLAKQISGAEEGAALAGQIVGSPAYMSPEQAAGRGGDVGVRSDVYALGVILYELLTGWHPYPVTGSILDVLRHVRETPPLPLRQNWSPDRGVTRRAASRAREVRCPIDGELEAVVLKALAKEPAGRYQSAGEFSQDIDNYLSGRATMARPDSRGQAVVRWVSRHRAATATGLSFLLVVLTALAFTFYLWRQASATLGVAEGVWSVWTGPLTKADASLVLEATMAAGEKLSPLATADHRLAEWGRDRHAQMNNLLATSLKQAIWTNELRTLNDSLARQPACPAPLGQIKDQGPVEEKLISGYTMRLELGSRVPFPKGRGQEALDALNALRILDPQNAGAARNAAAWGALSDRLPLVLKPDFREFVPDDRPAGWRVENGGWRVDARTGAGGSLILESTDSTDASLRVPVPSPMHAVDTVTEVSCQLEILGEGPDAGTIEGSNAVSLRNAANEVLCQLRFQQDGYFQSQTVAADGAADHVVGARVETGRTYSAMLRYFRNRGTFDVLIDGRFLVEEGVHPARFTQTAPDQLCLNVRHGGSPVRLSGLTVRTGSCPLKLDLGDLDVATTVDTLPRGFRPVRWYSQPADVFALQDWDGDGSVEILTGDGTTNGQVHVLGWRGEYVQDVVELAQVPIDPGHLARPVGAVDGLLVCDRVQVPHRGPDGVGSDTPALVFFQPEQDGKPREVQRRPYTSATEVSFCALRLGESRTGLALGRRGPDLRGLELLERDPANAAGPYTLLGTNGLTIAPGGEPNDVESVVPWDWDADGDDDLFVGLGHWSGYCPALVVMQDGMPEQIQPLTGPCGITRVAISDLGTRWPHVLVAAQKTDSAKVPEDQFGLRVWRVEDVRADAPTEPLVYEACNVIGLAAGTLDGREVAAVVSQEDYTEAYARRGPQAKYVIRIVTLDDEAGLQVLWSAEVLNQQPGQGWTLAFTDLDGDGEQELLARIGSRGFLIFAAMPATPPTAVIPAEAGIQRSSPSPGAPGSPRSRG